jgi:hypothetical protein
MYKASIFWYSMLTWDHWEFQLWKATWHDSQELDFVQGVKEKRPSCQINRSSFRFHYHITQQRPITKWTQLLEKSTKLLDVRQIWAWGMQTGRFGHGVCKPRLVWPPWRRVGNSQKCCPVKCTRAWWSRVPADSLACPNWMFLGAFSAVYLFGRSLSQDGSCYQRSADGFKSVFVCVGFIYKTCHLQLVQSWLGFIT